MRSRSRKRGGWVSLGTACDPFPTYRLLGNNSGFDPNQPRDESGQWTSGGGSSGKGGGGESDVEPTDPVQKRKFDKMRKAAEAVGRAGKAGAGKVAAGAGKVAAGAKAGVAKGLELKQKATDKAQSYYDAVYAKMPRPVQRIMDVAAWSARMWFRLPVLGHEAAQAWARRVMIRREFSEEKMQKRMDRLSQIDRYASIVPGLAGGFVGGVLTKSGIPGMGPLASYKAWSKIPVATSMYLGYSMVRSPRAWFKGAVDLYRDWKQTAAGKAVAGKDRLLSSYGAVKDKLAELGKARRLRLEKRRAEAEGRGKVTPPPAGFKPNLEELGPRNAAQNQSTARVEAGVQRMDEALRAHNGDEWFNALLCIAIDDLNDPDAAIAAAEDIYKAHPTCPVKKDPSDRELTNMMYDMVKFKDEEDEDGADEESDDDGGKPTGNRLSRAGWKPFRSAGFAGNAGTFDEKKHPRGQPGNAGQFGPGGGGGAAPAAAPTRKASPGEPMAGRYIRDKGAPAAPVSPQGGAPTASPGGQGYQPSPKEMAAARERMSQAIEQSSAAADQAARMMTPSMKSQAAATVWEMAKAAYNRYGSFWTMTLIFFASGAFLAGGLPLELGLTGFAARTAMSAGFGVGIAEMGHQLKKFMADSKYEPHGEHSDLAEHLKASSFSRALDRGKKGWGGAPTGNRWNWTTNMEDLPAGDVDQVPDGLVQLFQETLTKMARAMHQQPPRFPSSVLKKMLWAASQGKLKTGRKD